MTGGDATAHQLRDLARLRRVRDLDHAQPLDVEAMALPRRGDPGVTGMDITIHSSRLPHDDPRARTPHPAADLTRTETP